MSKSVSIDTAEHYNWGDGCDGWHLVRATGLSVIQERMPPNTSEVRHRHTRARQFFYVLQGELQLEVDGTVNVLLAGSGIEVEPGDAHQAFNRSNCDACFLVVSQPPSHGDRQMVADAAHDFPPGVAQPAVRALASIGVTKVSQLAKHREADVAELHGMGPKALGILKAALKKSGAKFKS